jgi:uncharacterized protein YcgI (DUF1989 family)
VTSPQHPLGARAADAVAVNREFYDRIADRTDARTLIESFTIPIRSGRAWEVPAGHVCRIVAVEGPQVGDLNVWNRDNPRERLWVTRTRWFQGAHLTTYDRLWSNLPYLRPLLTITRDSLARYGVDADGCRVHDLLGTRCDPYLGRLVSGIDFDFYCHSNLVRAILPYGLTEFDVHDNVNVFQVTGWTDEDHYVVKPSPVQKGEFLEFFAEIGLLCALSSCPAGDISSSKPVFFSPDARDIVETCRPLGVEVYSVEPGLLDDWVPPKVSAYHGHHGLGLPTWGEARDIERP